MHLGLRSGLLVLFLSPRAFALSQTNHYRVSNDACTGTARLPAASCHEIGMASHNTDSHEWTDLAAHAQIGDGQAVCAAVDGVLARARQLGAEARAQLFAQAAPGATPDQRATAGRAALAAFGRALHMLQDNCAHHGMPNPQHAWFSDSDLCRGTALSPDLPVAALDCARVETEAALQSFTYAVLDAGLSLGSLYQPDALSSTGPMFPSRSGLCEFLHLSGGWDGVDQGWDNDWVGPAMREELRRGLMELADPAPAACQLPAGTLDLKSPADKVTVGRGIDCEAIDAICAGDPTEPIIPPWENGKSPKKGLTCGAAPGELLAAAGALVPVLTRRRRRRVSG